MSDSVEDLIKTMTQLRELIREGHGVCKDLRQAIKEAKSVTNDLPVKVAAHLNIAVAAGLEEYTAALDQAIKKGEAAVTKRFDTLGAIFMGEDPANISEGRESLEEMAMRVRRHRSVQPSPSNRVQVAPEGLVARPPAPHRDGD